MTARDRRMNLRGALIAGTLIAAWQADGPILARLFAAAVLLAVIALVLDPEHHDPDRRFADQHPARGGNRD